MRALGSSVAFAGLLVGITSTVSVSNMLMGRGDSALQCQPIWLMALNIMLPGIAVAAWMVWLGITLIFKRTIPKVAAILSLPAGVGLALAVAAGIEAYVPACPFPTR